MIIYWDKKTNSKNRIGQRVKELRKAHNLTQKTLAAKLQLAGYDFNDLAILRIEQGTRFVPDYEVVALAEVFNVSCEYLLGLTDAPAKHSECVHPFLILSCYLNTLCEMNKVRKF